MTIENIETILRRLGGVLAYVTLAIVLYGVWRGTQRPAGRTIGRMGRFLRSPWFYLVSSALFFGISIIGWVPVPLTILQQARLWALGLGSFLVFTGLSLTLASRLALGKNYFVSTGFGAQLFQGHQLVTSGPFAIVRHPMYAGIILAAFGSLLLYHTWTTVMFACFAPLLVFRARREEAALAVEFGEQWQAYCRRVPAFFPRIRLSRHIR